jgi:outer membrane protein TolC
MALCTKFVVSTVGETLRTGPHRSIGLLLLVLFLSSGACWCDNGNPVLQDRVWTFDKCWRTACRNNPAMVLSDLEVQTAALEVEGAQKVFYPSARVSTAVNFGNVDNPDAELGYQYEFRIDPFLQGFEKFIAKDQAALKYKISQYNQAKAEALLRYRVSVAYLQLMAYDQAQDCLDRIIELQKKRIQLHGGSLDAEADALRRIELQKELRRTRIARIDLDNDLYNWQLKLTTALALAPDTPLRVNPHEDVDTIIGTSAERPVQGKHQWLASTDARLGELELTLIRMQRRLAGWNDFPKPFIQAGWSEGLFSMSSGAYVIGGLDIPIWDWGRNQRVKKSIDLRQRQREVAQKARCQAWISRVAGLRHTIDNLRLRRQLVEETIQQYAMQQRLLSSHPSPGESDADAILLTRIGQTREKNLLALLDGKLWLALCQLESIIKIGSLDDD